MDTTLKRALTRWLVTHRPGRTPDTLRYHWQTVKQIRRAWRDVLPKPVDQVNADDVARFASRAGYFCASRWNGMLTVLYATVPITRELLRRRTPKMTRPPPPTQQEFAKLLVECDGLARSRAGLVINFLAHSGLRITAARNVKWGDVYEERIEYIAKGGRLCSVPIINGMRDVLKELKELSDGSEFVLPRPAVRRGLAKACDKAGLRRMNHHDFRHLFTTRCLESGVDVGTVARWRGDSDGGAMLLKRYFHLLDEHSRRMALRVKI